MMTDPQPPPWQETLLFCQAHGRSISPSLPSNKPGLFSFSLQSVGGALLHRQLFPGDGVDEDCGLAWQIDNSTRGVLRLTDFSVAQGPLHAQLSLEFEQQLYAGLALLAAGQQQLRGACILSNGLLAHFPLPLAGGQGRATAGLTPDLVQHLDISGLLGPLGSPVSLTACAEHVCIGTTSGSVLSIPLQTLHDGNLTRAFEVRESGWGLMGLINGVLQRHVQPEVVACIPLHPPPSPSPPSLLVVYNDCTLRGFHLGKRIQLFSDGLGVDQRARGYTPCFASCHVVDGAADGPRGGGGGAAQRAAARAVHAAG